MNRPTSLAANRFFFKSSGRSLSVVAGQRSFRGIALAAYSYLSSSDPRVHFGLGTIEAVDAVVVSWPDGTRERFTVEGIDRVVVLRRGEGADA